MSLLSEFGTFTTVKISYLQSSPKTDYSCCSLYNGSCHHPYTSSTHCRPQYVRRLMHFADTLKLAVNVDISDY